MLLKILIFFLVAQIASTYKDPKAKQHAEFLRNLASRLKDPDSQTEEESEIIDTLNAIAISLEEEPELTESKEPEAETEQLIIEFKCNPKVTAHAFGYFRDCVADTNFHEAITILEAILVSTDNPVTIFDCIYYLGLTYFNLMWRTEDLNLREIYQIITAYLLKDFYNRAFKLNSTSSLNKEQKAKIPKALVRLAYSLYSLGKLSEVEDVVTKMNNDSLCKSPKLTHFEQNLLKIVIQKSLR